MYIGKTLFAQLMDFLPWKTFHRITDRCDGDRYVKAMTCADQFRVLAFAQLTYRESLRDIEVCLSAQAAKLYHMGFRHEIKRSTLADANETRDWRIHAEFAQCLIAIGTRAVGRCAVLSRSVPCAAGLGVAHPLTQGRRVELPQRCGQSGGEAYPSEIRHEQKPRQLM
jgi:hypothetical protein